MKLPSKKWLVAIGIILLFVITNPGIAAFKAFVGSNSYSGLKRTDQFFLCSLYQHQNEEYFALLGNFWKVAPGKPTRSQIVADSIKIADSAKMADNMANAPADTSKIDTSHSTKDPFKEFGGKADK